MSARAEQAPLRTHERQVATANRAEEHKSSVADGRPGTQWWRKVTLTGTGRMPSTLADSAEHCQGRAGALAHHGFEGNAWYVDNLAQFGTAEQTLRGVGHARGRAVERARGGGAHAGDCAVIALLALYLVTTSHQPCQHFVALFELRHHAAPLVQKRAQRQQRSWRAAQHLHRAQGIVPVTFGREAGEFIHPNGAGEAAALGEMFHDGRGERGALPETHPLS